jgi:site-specific recombinase XerD
MSCEYLLEQFKTKLCAEGLRDQTIRSYIADTQQYCKWLDNYRGIPAENASQNDAKAFLDYLQSEVHELRPGKFGTYSLSTIRRKIGVLRRFYYAILEE